jgi:DNA polymerase-1
MLFYRIVAGFSAQFKSKPYPRCQIMQRIEKNALFVIDGSSFLFRAYYGLRPLHTQSGIPVQATYGFCRMLKKLITDFEPRHMVLVWDSRGKTFRSEIYEDYKANRQAPPSDLSLQKEQILEIAQAIGLFQVAQSGYEADDLIASIVKKYPHEQIVIVSSDKDLQQLITSNVVIFDAFKNEVVDGNAFTQKYGFTPPALLLYHSLLGDASDNIPGVKGIGKKGAEELTQQFETLENLYDHLKEVPKERTRTLLEESRHNAFLSRDLFLLKEIDIDAQFKDFTFEAANWNNAYELFNKLEFKSFIKESVQAKPASDQQSVFAGVLEGSPRSRELDTAPQREQKRNWTCTVITTEEDLAALIEKIHHAGEFAFDTETTGLKPLEDKLVGISLAYETQTGYYIPLAHPQDGTPQLEIAYVINALKPLFENAAIKKYAHCAKFDQLVLKHNGLSTIGLSFDTLLAANLLRKSWQKIGLKVLSNFYLNEPMQTFKEVIGKKYKTFAQVPLEEGAPYGAHDALQTYKLAYLFSKELESSDNAPLKKILHEIEMPFSDVLCAMEQAGILVDPAVLSATGKQINDALAVLEGKIYAAIKAHRGTDEEPTINLNSPQQLEVLLFEEFKLPAVRISKEGHRSTDQEVLTELSKDHPVPGMLLEYRALYKLKSTYIEPLLECINPHTKRIHTNYNQTDVATGRLSSNNPNMQNIPATRGYGVAIRSAFIAPSEKLLLSADYSQIELRVLAHVTQDPQLCKAFKEGRDIHRETAAEIFKTIPEFVTSEQRNVGKRINFSIMYGLTPFGLAGDLDIKPGEAKEYIDAYFKKYTGVKAWIESTVAQATIDGYVTTLYGRRRYVPELQERNKTLYEQGRRVAMNSPIQGTQADIMKIAMIKLYKTFQSQGLKARILLQIHDEIIVEFDKNDEKTIKNIIKADMENAVKLSIPLPVEIRIGQNWGEITK